ncbi:MAG: hypothetical protein WCQ50_22020, partial [Spirochaetota bacterium]
LRRKGRMTDKQLERRVELEKERRPNPKGLERSFARVALEGLRVLSDGARPSLILWTDEHKSYGRAMANSACLMALREAKRLNHQTFSSRAERTLANPLFPVNYLDREIRKDIHEHVRETVCFGRNVNRQMERFTLYSWWHNYRKPHRVRERVFRSHAEVAGYDCAHIAKASQTIWKRRAMLSLTELAEPWIDTWLRSRTSPGMRGPDYLPRYALG